MIGDWFHFLLSNRVAQEESNASTTQVWNPVRRSWSEQLIGFAGLPPRIFPPVVPPCTRLGALTLAIQAETGLGPIEVVAGCVHDTAAWLWAGDSGRGASGWAVVYQQWHVVACVKGTAVAAGLAMRGRAANFTNETGVGGTSRFLRNASGLWILQECRRAWAR